MVGEQRRVGFFVGPVVASVSRAAMSYLPGLAEGARTPPHGSTFSSLFGRRFIVASPSRPPSCAPLGPSGPQTRERVAHKTAAQATTRGGRKGSIFSFWPGLKVFNPNFACGADVLPANVPPHSVPQPGGCSLHVAKDPPQGRKREKAGRDDAMFRGDASQWVVLLVTLTAPGWFGVGAERHSGSPPRRREAAGMVDHAAAQARSHRSHLH
jgi:hypothetical protein